MPRSEKRWLIAGILLGAITVAAVYEVLDRRRSSPPAPPAQTVAVEEAAPPAGLNVETGNYVELTSDEQKAIGVETVEVKRQTIRKEIAAPGKVAEPESGIGTVSARIGGRVDKLFVKVTGETIARGQPVASIYSPEVFTAGEEYKLSLENRQRLSASKEPQAISEADDLVRASRRRLELRGLTEQQIEEIASLPERPIEIAVYSPISGIVTKRSVSEGQYVKEGDVLLEIADLSTVWVEANIFESDIPLIRIGQAVKISAPALGGGSLRGSVSFLQPSVDPQTRTMTARIQVPNPQMRLRPGTFVQVLLDTPLGGDTVAVPRSAVLETGKEKVVYISMGNGVFEKRSIEAAGITDDYYAATRGIAAGERVVTHGSFLIDSQTRLTGTITGMFGGSKAFAAGGAPEKSDYMVSLRSDPSPLKGGSDGTFHASVTGPDGKPVSDAQVQVTLVMPAMPAMGMGEMRSSFSLAWNGSDYSGGGTIPMAGPWNVTVEARRSGQLLGAYRSRLEAK